MTDRGNWDFLWEGNIPGRKWVARLEPDQIKWLEELADAIIAKDSEPVWAKVHAAFVAKWPKMKPARQTVSTTVRELVEERRG
jgi:hypothetical protein